nr:hypothetical protein [Tanacetum cinerariifolium]
MNPQETQQVGACDEKWVPSTERVKISSTNVRLETNMQQKEETFQVIINVIKNFTCFKAFTITAEVPESFMRQFWYTIKKVQDGDDDTLTFLTDLGYRGPLHKYTNMLWITCTNHGELWQPLSTSVSLGRLQTDKALIYDSEGLAEVQFSNNCYNNEIFNIFTQEEQYTKLLEPILEPHRVLQNDSNVISEASSVEQGERTIEKHPATVVETLSADRLSVIPNGRVVSPGIARDFSKCRLGFHHYKRKPRLMENAVKIYLEWDPTSGTDNESDDASVHSQAINAQQQPNIQPQIITTVSNHNAKFSYFKKDEYEVWAMKMEYWITNNDMNIWKVIQNGNSLKRTGRDRDGGIIILPPTTAEEHIAVQRESKARTTLLQSIPDDHVADFHYMDDARDIWNVVKAKFGGNVESKKMRKSMLKQEFLDTTSASKRMSHGDSPSYSSNTTYSVSSNSKTGSHRSSNALEDVLQSFVADTEPEQQLAYEDFKQIEKLDLEEMDLKWQMAMLSIRVYKFEQKAGRKIDFDKKESARFNKKKVRCYKYHDDKSDEVITAKEFGMITGCDSEDKIKEGAAKIYNLITGANSEEANTAGDAGEFALIGVTSEIVLQRNQLTLEENIRVLSIELENTSNLLKHSERINADVETAKKDLQTKLDNHLVQTKKWRNSSKNLFRLIDSSMSVRTKVGLGFNDCIRENELGWDDSTFSVFTTNSEDVEGRPLFYKFAKTDSMKAMPPPLIGNYTSLSDHIDLDESQMSDKSSEVNTNDFASSDSSVKSSEHKPNDSTSCASTSSVNIPPVRPQPVPTGKPKVSAPVPIGKPKVSTPVPTGKPTVSTPVPTGRPNRPSPFPTDRGYSPSENPFSATGDEGIFYSGCSRSMTGNKERLDDFQAFQGGKVTFGGGEDTECLVLSKNFKLPDDSMVVLRVLKKHNLYTINLNNLCPRGNLACLVAHALFDESMKWHRLMGHVNYKNMNRLVKGNLVRGLPPKLFKNGHTYVACCKGIKREYSNPRTQQQNEVAKRKNKTLIEATKTMLVDSKLHTMFWTEAVRTACYVLNRVSVTSPHNKTPYALLTRNIPSVNNLKPFGCHVTILNISDHLGKFDGKADEGYIVGYSASNKAYRVYNVPNKRVEESMNLRFLEEKPNVQGTQGAITNSTGTPYTNSNSDCDEQVIIVPSYPSHNIQRSEPNDTSGDEVDDSPFHSADELFQKELARLKGQEQRVTSDAESLGLGFANNAEALQTQTSAKTVPPVPADSTMVSTNDVPIHTSSSTDLIFDDEPTTRFFCLSDLGNHAPSPSIFSSSSYDDEFGAALNNVASTVEVSPVETKRINTIHPQSLIIGDPTSAVKTRSKVKQTTTGDSAFISYIFDQQRDNHTDFHHCLFACFLSQVKPRSVAQALEDPSWVDAMQEEMQQFKFQNVWVLVDLPAGKYAIGTKWILKNKRDARGIVVCNKARLVAQGHRQEEGIDYDEVFAPVSKIEAIKQFLAFASYMGFLVYQMDVKSAFLYERIDEEVYVTQPKGFMDPHHPKKVYKVVKALYGLHQAPRAWYVTLSTFLLKHGYRRGTIDKTLFPRKNNRDIILVQVYMDDIIFGSTKKAWCDEFEALIKGEFQMSAMGELTFFLGSVRMATTPYEAPKPKSKNESDSPVNVHLYRSMIGSLMYLTASRPDIMFAVSAYSRNQVTPTTSNLEAVKKIFKYLKGQPKLGLWYPKESPLVREAYSDSDYAGANKDRKSTTGGCQFLGRWLISWQCKKQTIVATSSTEAEYVTAANCCGQVLWIQNQLLDYGAPELGPSAILATIDKTPYTITKDLVRSRLQLADDGGIADLPIAEIYSGMDNLGYVTEGKFTFYKNKFSLQWRFLVHTLLHCLSTKFGSWDQFGSPLAVALICLSKPVPITVVRPVTTVVPKIKVTRPRHVKPIVTKPNLPTRRHINRRLSPKSSNSPPRVTAVKALMGNPQHALKDKEVINSGCSRHMTVNMSYLSDFEELNGGYVAFGGNPKGGKISRKGKIKTGNLNAKTLNVKTVYAMCDKCVLYDKHDMCVLESVAKPIKKTVASESNKKPRNFTRKLYERVSKTCSWWYPKFTPSGYKWKPKSEKENVNLNVSIPLGNVSRTANVMDTMTSRRSIVSNTPLSSNSFAARRDCPIHHRLGCSKHMMRNLKLLVNFMEKFLGTVKFGNDQIAPILGYGDLVQGAVTIKRVYYVEGLNHNLFFVGQFCDADLEVAFRKSTCFIRDLKGNDLLTGSHGMNLYSITLQDTNSPNLICLMAKATSSQAWLWHRRLSHLNFDTINLLSKNDIVAGLPKFKFIKDHLCSSCELGKAKRKSFHTKLTPSSKRRLQLLHMDLCGPMRVASIYGKRYVLVIVDDYFRYTWTHFLRSTDETPEVLIDFLRLVQRGLQAQVRVVRTNKGTKFLNQTLHAYFATEGILHQTSVARTPEQNS